MPAVRNVGGNVAEGRLTSGDKRALVLWVLLGAVGVVFAQRYFFRAFPEASVDFKVSRKEALERARQFVESAGENVNGYESAIVFDVDDNAKTYLERELGLQEANRLMSSELNIWYWNARFFKPGQEEEFYVRVNPAGKIVGYDHRIEETHAGASLERAAAEQTAQNFLAREMGENLNQWTFLPEEANSSNKPNRVDWSFTWEKQGFRAKEAPYRLHVTLHGGRPGEADEFLRVPEAWQRSYEHLRSTNNFLNTVALIPYLLLMGSAVWIGITLMRQGRTSWGPALKLGAVVAVLLTFMQLNNWPLDRMGYDTNTTYGSFVFQAIGLAILFGIGSALTVVLPIPGGEPLYRMAQPGNLRLMKAFTLRGMRTVEFFRSAVIGLAMAAAHIGFIVAFYIVANHFGAWAPEDLNYENSVNTAIPWIAGVAIGMLAATSEEFLFRLFAVPFLKRLTGSTAVAVIVPAFCWSFLHAGYPNEPPYIRGLEVGLIGIVAGLVLLRWGILATLIWHYTVDASLVGLLLVRSNSLYFKISGVVVGLAALAPLIFAGVSYLARGRFEEDTDLLNSAEPIEKISLEPVQEAAAAPMTTRRYDALAPGMIIFLVVCCAAGGVLTWKLKTPEVGDYLKLSVSAKTAKAKADAVLRQHGADPGSYRTATIFMDIADPYVNEFLRERVGIARVNEIYEKQVPGAIWQVRYFRDGQPEEYSIKLGPDGGFLAYHHKVADDAAGASLTKEEAQTKAAQYLTATKKLDLSQWTLVEANSDKRTHRTDHEFSWQENAALDADKGAVQGNGASGGTDHAYARVKVAVAGDEVMDYRDSYYDKPESREEAEAREGAVLWEFIKIPEEWRRKQEAQSLPRTVYAFGVPVVLLGIGIAAIVVFLMNVKSELIREIPWKRLAVWGVLALMGTALSIGCGDRLQAFLSTYSTAIPFKTMVGTLVIGVLLGGAFTVGGVILLAGLAAYFGARAFGLERLAVGKRMPGVYYRDAFFIGLGGAAGFLGVRHVIGALSQYWVTLHRSLPATGMGQDFDAIWPAGMAIGGTLTSALYVTGILVFVAGFVAAMVKARWLRLALFVLGAMFLAGSDWGNGADFAKQFLGQAVLLAVIVFGVRKIVRFNVLGALLAVACLALAGAAVQFLGQPESFYKLNGYVVVAALVVLLAYPLVVWRMSGVDRETV